MFIWNTMIVDVQKIPGHSSDLVTPLFWGLKSYSPVCASSDMGYVVAVWLRHYAMSKKVAGLRPKLTFSIYLSLPAAQGPGQPLTEYQKQKNKVSESV
jgi:hypothetical protein